MVYDGLSWFTVVSDGFMLMRVASQYNNFNSSTVSRYLDREISADLGFQISPRYFVRFPTKLLVGSQLVCALVDCSRKIQRRGGILRFLTYMFHFFRTICETLMVCLHKAHGTISA